jgi:23S rRNA pseudouridine1911/1915/1917 synthase
MKSLKLTISAETRLDLALAQTLEISRSQAQKLLKDGLVSVPDKVATPHLLMAPGAKVTLTKAVPKKKKTIKDLPPLEILYEDKDVIVVSKPAGLLVHKAPGSEDATLADSLLKYYPAMKKAGEDENRHGIVHRLDKEASGVLITAKNGTAFRHLKQQFSNRETEKNYTVLVLGAVKENQGTIRFPIARSNTRARMAARPEGQEGKEAITHFKVAERFSSSTLLDVKIETGRTHQIRAHFFALGHPVAGDALYLRKDIKPLTGLNRLFLHAKALTITLPSGERKTFEAPLPPELQEILKHLKVKKSV